MYDFGAWGKSGNLFPGLTGVLRVFRASLVMRTKWWNMTWRVANFDARAHAMAHARVCKLCQSF
jgi:hypothetical protein